MTKQLKTYILDEQGNPVEYTPAIEVKQADQLIKAVTKIENHSAVLDIDNLTPEIIAERLGIQKKVIQAIVKEMILGVHYIELPNIPTPFMTQAGANFLARSLRLRIDTEIIDKVVDIANNVLMITTKSRLYNGTQEVYSAMGHANAGEDAFIGIYWDTKKDKPKAGKSIYDAYQQTLAMSEKRSSVMAVRRGLAMTNDFTQDADLMKDPLAKAQAGKDIYTKHFYPAVWDHENYKAKKYKTHKGTNKRLREFDNKELIQNQRDFWRLKYFQPALIANGIATSNWKVSDIEKIKELLPEIIKKARS